MKKNELLKHYGMTQNTSLTDDELMLLLNYLETENDKLKEHEIEIISSDDDSDEW